LNNGCGANSTQGLTAVSMIPLSSGKCYIPAFRQATNICGSWYPFQLRLHGGRAEAAAKMCGIEHAEEIINVI
jgi:hypothetical protein